MQIKIIYSNILPVKGFKAINLAGIIFARKEYLPLNKQVINHERIHSHQIKELLVLGFYLWYVIEWAIRLIQYKDRYTAYRNISFEREAFVNDSDFSYLQHRRIFSFLKYMIEKQQCH